MLNNTLDTLIAVVIVLLVLSLIVQSVQEVIKKLLKLKSRQIEESLVDLFETVIDETKAKLSATDLKESRFQLIKKWFQTLLNAPAFQALPQWLKSWTGIKHPSELASERVQAVFNNVMKEFQNIGRVAISEKQALNSISKEDLIKVLRRIEVNQLLPPFASNFETACAEFKNVSTALEEAIAIVPALTGEAGIKFAKLRDTLTPILNDLHSFFKADGGFNQDLLLADVLNLRGINLSEVLDLLGSVQRKIDTELVALPAPDAARQAELENAKQTLGKIAQHLTEMNQKLDAALAPLRLKLAEVENWYDTVMQSFEERYARGMKTVAFVISLIVAVWLNANIFAVYSGLAKSQTQRDAVLQYGPEALKNYNEAQAKAIAENNEASQKKLKDQIKETKDELTKATNAYASLGFPPLREEGRTLKGWYDDPKLMYGEKVWNIGRHCFYLLFGWLLMAALLSVGAPFWNDTLQSLFGVKSLLQKKGAIKNTEQKAGEGQTKS